MLWKRRIQTYFKNHRQRALRDRPEVKHRLGKRPGVATEFGVKKVKNAWGLANFAPSRPGTEDDTSIQVIV